MYVRPEECSTYRLAVALGDILRKQLREQLNGAKTTADVMSVEITTAVLPAAEPHFM